MKWLRSLIILVSVNMYASAEGILMPGAAEMGKIAETQFGNLQQNIASLQTINGIININYGWGVLFYQAGNMPIPGYILYYHLMKAGGSDIEKLIPNSSEMDEDMIEALEDGYHDILDDKDSIRLIQEIAQTSAWVEISEIVAYYRSPKQYIVRFSQAKPKYMRLVRLQRAMIKDTGETCSGEFSCDVKK